MALMFAVGRGAEGVWVTSSSGEKLERARGLGAKGGVNYREEGWEKRLVEMVGGEVDVIVDGAGGDIASRAVRVLKVRGSKFLYLLPVVSIVFALTSLGLPFHPHTLSTIPYLDPPLPLLTVQPTPRPVISHPPSPTPIHPHPLC